MHDNDNDLAAVFELLHAMDKKIDLHIQQYNKHAPKIDELVSVLDRSKGVLIFLQWVGGIAATLYAVGYWVKDHVKF